MGLSAGCSHLRRRWRRLRASRALSRRSSFIFRVDRKITVGEKMSIVACVRPHTGELISCLMRARESDEQLLDQKQRSAPNPELQLHEEPASIIIGSL